MYKLQVKSIYSTTTLPLKKMSHLLYCLSRLQSRSPNKLLLTLIIRLFTNNNLIIIQLVMSLICVAYDPYHTCYTPHQSSVAFKASPTWSPLFGMIYSLCLSSSLIKLLHCLSLFSLCLSTKLYSPISWHIPNMCWQMLIGYLSLW